MANKLFEGDLGQLGWGLFNVQRIWRMTGGQVQAHMGDYANYSAQQQQAIAALGGTQGYTGPVADVIGQTNAVKRFGLGMGKAGWDMFGWIPQAIGGSGLHRSGPANGRHVSGDGRYDARRRRADGRAGEQHGRQVDRDEHRRCRRRQSGGHGGDREWAWPIRRLALAPVAGMVGSAAGGAAVGTALAYDINRGGFLGTGLGKDAWSADKDFGTWHRRAFAQPGLSGIQSSERRWSLRLRATLRRWPDIQAGEGGLRQLWGMTTEETEAQKQYRRYSDWGTNLERSVPTLQAGEGLQVAKLIAKTSGISDGALTERFNRVCSPSRSRGKV